ncbi:chromosome replication initiation inhibitor protein [Janibacter sp. HTCC2649]|uniref:LysR family transcriptional regulator ArgP n=1 Tax=Janibacter sp. HTCC2649 TaxID=313589 RepID=UPI00006718FA|nr:LysR family transcriptional regulator ArgP [Janibacter sp. HTCC2649]EAP97937.1 chromosome replication initiation inhibitor protein [Janibacter sp. HTCC2649]
MHTDQLRALLAVVDTGTFEAAARELHVTPSAVSQRIKALEHSMGQVVVRRGQPCAATAAGEVLVRLARQQHLLEQEAQAALDESAAATELPIAVNADSLATWFRPILREVADWDGVVLRLHVEDEGHSHELLRAGTVLGAITSNPVPVQGCSVERIGGMRYLPVATPELREQFALGRGVDWERMPVLEFNDHDDLQRGVLRGRGVEGDPPTHRIPSSEAFAEAVRAGLGWGALPTVQCTDDLDAGRLVRLSAREHVDVPLHWQSWRLRSPLVERLTEAIRHHAPTR